MVANDLFNFNLYFINELETEIELLCTRPILFNII